MFRLLSKPCSEHMNLNRRKKKKIAEVEVSFILDSSRS